MYDRIAFGYFVATVVGGALVASAARAQGPPDIVWQQAGTGEVRAATFSPDGQTLASGSGNHIALWQVLDGAFIRSLTSAQTYYVSGLDFSPDGQTLVSNSVDSTLQWWRVSDGALIRTLWPYQLFVNVAISPDGQLVAAGRFVWHLSDGTVVRQHPVSVNSVAFSPDSQLLLTGGGEVKLWRVSDWSLVRTFVGPPGAVYTVAYSPDGQLVTAGGTDIFLWRASDGALLNTLSGHTETIWSVAFGPGGRTLASGSGDRTIRSWRVSDGVLLHTYDQEMGTGVFSVEHSPNGRFFAYGRRDGIVVLARHVETLTPHAYTLVRGILLGGQFADLFSSDDSRMALRPGAVVTTAEAPIQLVLETTSPYVTATKLAFRLEAHTNIANIGQKVEMYDFAAGRWTLLDSRLASTTDSLIEVTAGGDPARFLRAGDNLLRARLSWKEAGPVFSYPWVARIDQAVWRLTP